MPETHDERTGEADHPALDEFRQNLAVLNESMSSMMSSALRMQMLILEDAQNMLGALNSAIDEAAGDDGRTNGGTNGD